MFKNLTNQNGSLECISAISEYKYLKFSPTMEYNLTTYLPMECRYMCPDFWPRLIDDKERCPNEERCPSDYPRRSPFNV